MPYVALLGSEHVHEGLSHTAKHPVHGLGQLCVGQLCAHVKQTQVRPEVIFKQVGKSSRHCFVLLLFHSSHAPSNAYYPIRHIALVKPEKPSRKNHATPHSRHRTTERS